MGDEMQVMMALAEWPELLRVAAEDKATSWRHLLAIHTSTSCMPQHNGGIVPSLKAIGLDTNLAPPPTGLGGGAPDYQVRVVLPALFEKNPVLPHPEPYWCVSKTHGAMVDAQEEVCQLTLAFMLGIAPNLVRLHPNAWKRGDNSIARLQTAAAVYRPRGLRLGLPQTT